MTQLHNIVDRFIQVFYKSFEFKSTINIIKIFNIILLSRFEI